MDDLELMIQALQDFLSEHKEELLFLDITDSRPDYVSHEDMFFAQLDVMRETGRSAIALWDGDPRFGHDKTQNLHVPMYKQNHIALKHLAGELGKPMSILVKDLVHDFLRTNGIVPHTGVRDNKTKRNNPPMKTRPVDLDALSEKQYEDLVIDPELEIEHEVIMIDREQVRFYWCRNATQYY